MKYSKSIRQEVFVKYVCGYTPKEIAKKTGIHFVTIYRWVNIWRKNLNDRPLTNLPLQDVGTILTYTEDLKRRLEEADRSLSIIHTSGILQTIPLKQRIDMMRPFYDYIIIDCGLKHELLTVNALVASDYCIVPVQAHFLASEGIL